MTSPDFVTGSDPGIPAGYDAGVFAFQKRMSKRFTLGGSYSLRLGNDNADCSTWIPR